MNMYITKTIFSCSVCIKKFSCDPCVLLQIAKTFYLFQFPLIPLTENTDYVVSVKFQPHNTVKWLEIVICLKMLNQYGFICFL